MSPRTVILAVAFTAGAPALLWLWLKLADHAPRLLPVRWRGGGLAAVWLAPALLLMGVFLVWPLLYTGYLSVHGPDGGAFAGAANYRYLAESAEVHAALRNNVLWLVLLVGAGTLIGLLVAVLGDRVRYEPLAKAVIILPTAIPFVAGAVIWRFMFQYQPPGLPQVGTLNAVWTSLTGAEPVTWLVDSSTNNLALIMVGIWMSAGVATVVLSAAVKNVPIEVVEAARVDGAGAWAVFRHITLPQLRPAIVVVATLLAITAFKAFDLVYVMTNGNYDTNVIANLMYQKLFIDQDYGRASAIAVLLTLIALPVMVLNARRAVTENI